MRGWSTTGLLVCVPTMLLGVAVQAPFPALGGLMALVIVCTLGVLYGPAKRDELE